jgi:hypothetical protein
VPTPHSFKDANVPRGHPKNPKAKQTGPRQTTVDAQDVPVAVRQPAYGESVLPFPVALVEWVDACHVRGEVPADDVGAVFKSPLLQSVGYLVMQEQDFVTIAQEWTPATRDWRFLMRIPRVCVKRIVTLVEEQKSS